MRQIHLLPAGLMLLVVTLGTAPLMAAKSDKLRLSDIPDETDKKRRKEPPPADPSPEEKRQMMRDVASDFYNKGESLLKNGQLVQAKSYYERVLVLVPGHVAAQTRVNQINLKLESQTPIPKKPVKDPSTQLLKKLQWDMEKYAAEKDWQDAYASAKKLLALDPSHAKGRAILKSAEANLYDQAVRRGEMREKAGELQSAVDAYQVALTYKMDPVIHDKIAALQSKLLLGNRRKSEEIYLRALKATQEGRNKEALQLCAQALKIDPSNIQARRMQERLKGKN